MKKTNYFALSFENDNLILLDQTKLPFSEEYIKTDDYERIAIAIERLEVRGAPAIGVAAAYGLALSLKSNPDNPLNIFIKAYDRLVKTRPTAVNLFFALNEIKDTYTQAVLENKNVYEACLNKAKEIHEDDIVKCDLIGKNGLRVFRKKSNVLTHCNTGKLATAGEGTAFNVIKTGFEKGMVNYVYADETRPLFQGGRLTAFELEKNGIPFSVLTDSSAAYLMQSGKVDLVVTGADRIALNGDTANKVGTYSLAVLCNYHNIPFYIAAPTTTIDRKIPSGEFIDIEFRSSKEVVSINGNNILNENLECYTPAFDVTPAHLITGIITEVDVYQFPYNFLK